MSEHFDNDLVKLIKKEKSRHFIINLICVKTDLTETDLTTQVHEVAAFFACISTCLGVLMLYQCVHQVGLTPK